MNRLSCMAFFFLLTWCSTGCQQRNSTAPPVAKVKGTVSLDGKPMAGGEVRFNVVGQPVKSIEVKDGAFSGEAFVGKTRVDVVWEKDGPPNPMNPSSPIKVNVVSDNFSGPNSPFNFDVSQSGPNEFKLDVASARR